MMGSRVRVTQAAPNFLKKISCLERFLGTVFCFPDPDAKVGEAGGKQQKAKSSGLSAATGIGSVPRPLFSARTTSRNGSRRAPP
jgi:hypothetical protein